MGVYDRDYMRRRDYNGPDLRKVGLVLLVVLAVGGAWAIGNRRRPPQLPAAGAADARRPVRLAVERVPLGDFELPSGTVAVSDPGYTRRDVTDGRLALRVRDIRTGRWTAEMVRYTVDEPGHVRCGELIVHPVDLPPPADPAWVELHPAVGVDSGQAGFFDWTHFQSAKVVPADHRWRDGRPIAPDDPWYSLCCDITLGRTAGVLPYGAVASSGWGDGGYPLYGLKDAAGKVVGLRLVFIPADELTPAEDDAP